MKFIRVILLLSALGLSVFAQQVNVTANKIKVETPSGACSAGSVRVTTAGALWTCVSGTWTAAGGGGLTVGATTITGGTTTRVLYDNAGVVGEYVITGTGNVVMSASPTLTGRISAADGLYATTVTTGTGTTAGLQVTANSLTTGNGLDVSSSSVTTGNIVKITGTSTAAASNTLTGLNIAMSGANGTAAQTVTGQTISVTNTNATSGTNVGLTLTASGATTANTALNITAGHVLWTTDNTYDIGANGANRPHSIYVGTTVRAATNVVAENAVYGVAVYAATTTGFTAGVGLNSASDGVVRIANWAASDFGRLQFGGTTSSFPALKRSTTTLQVRLADDSADAGLTVSYVNTVPVTVANLPAAATAGAGARAFVTDASTTTILGLGLTVTGGGANKVPVYSDGTNWLIG